MSYYAIAMAHRWVYMGVSLKTNTSHTDAKRVPCTLDLLPMVTDSAAVFYTLGMRTG